MTCHNVFCGVNSMPEEVVKDPSEDFSAEDVENTFKRDLENFKKKIDRLVSE